jgi:RNA polymerase sigma factor (TIGR02999 family)
VSAPNDITALLARLQLGKDADAEAQLVESAYHALRAIAKRRLSAECGNNSIQVTELVNETYLRLFSAQPNSFTDRTHFFAVAAQAMRRVLVDHARRRAADKRGGGYRIVALEDGLAHPSERPEQMLAMDDALRRLAERDERAARVVELRVFSGLTNDETAAVLGVSARTVKREWRFGRAWLQAELGEGDDNGELGPA